ncbi:MAG: hypothetical protein KIS90_12860, partial [Phenylobacterium sp.]|nr:hypothetical protein [Phenylobacterium sp.]
AAIELEARGRQVYAAAIRSGQQVIARTPADVRRLGLAAVTGQLPVVLAETAARKAAPKAQAAVRETEKFVRAVASPDAYQREQALKKAREQARAATSGFVDEASFHLADRALSAGGALAEGGLAGFGDRYSQNMDVKRAEDAYDQEHYGLARNAGRIAGVGTGIAVLGAPATLRGAVALTPRGAELVQALTKSRYALDPRGLTTMAATGGAGAGLVSQAVSDAMSGRVSPASGYGGAALGGAIDGVGTLRLGPVIGGGLGGVATTVAQDRFAGRPTSVDDAIDNAQASAILGGLGGAGAAYGTSRLSIRDKGNLGELASQMKTMARGDGVPYRQGRRFKLGGRRYTVTDLQFDTNQPGKSYGIGESKVGPTAKLSPRQIEAQARPDVDYVVDGWRYSDFGKMGGAAASPFAVYLEDDEPSAWGRW